MMNTFSELPVIDLRRGAELAGGKESLALEMMDLLRESLPNDRQEIVTAYNKHQLNEVSRLVHRLHGAVSYCGTPQLKAVTATFDRLLHQQPPSPLQEIESLYDDLLTAIDRVMAANQ